MPGDLSSVVAQSNYAINNIKDYSGPQVSEKAKVQAYAEARFMRGLAYWYIGSLWNKGIIYENTAEQVNNSVVPANRGVDVIEFAIRDLEYAAVNLSKTWTDGVRDRHRLTEITGSPFGATAWARWR